MEETDVNEQGSETQPAETSTQVDSSPAEFAIPDSYKEAGWAKNIKSYDDLWKQHENAQKLIGRKTIGIPTSDSSEEEIEQFYAKVRPESLDGYDFDLAEDTDFFKDVFYKSGISARQAKALTDAYKESVRKSTESLYSENGFKEVMKNALGDEYSTKIEKVNAFLKQYGKKSALDEIEQLPNETLGLLYGLINLTMDKYAVKELGSVSNGIEQKSAMNNEKDMAEYMQEMMALDKDPFVSKEKKDAIRRKYGFIK